MIPELGHFALALGVAVAGALAGFPPWGAHDRNARLMATAPPLVACRAHDRGRLYIARLQRQSSGEHAWSRHPDAIARVALRNTMQTLARTAGAELSGMQMPRIESPAPLAAGLLVATATRRPVSIKLLREIEQGAPCMAIDDQQLPASPVELRAATTTVSTAFTIVALRAAASGADK